MNGVNIGRQKMTEQRYSDGTLAKWYYSRSNTICDGINEYSLLSKEKFEYINFEKILGTNDLLDDLNRLSDENEQLKQYKQAVNDVLLSWSQKNLTAKELGVICALIEELNVKV